MPGISLLLNFGLLIIITNNTPQPVFKVLRTRYLIVILAAILYGRLVLLAPFLFMVFRIFFPSTINRHKHKQQISLPVQCPTVSFLFSLVLAFSFFHLFFVFKLRMEILTARLIDLKQISAVWFKHFIFTKTHTKSNNLTARWTMGKGAPVSNELCCLEDFYAYQPSRPTLYLQFL